MRFFDRDPSRPTRIFYAADLHGSEVTYRKFLNAARFYGVDALVFGGDLMGKALVPIVRENGTLRAHFQGEDHVFESDGEHTMITVGLSTHTPWDTPREASEAEIATAIEQNVSRVPDVARCVFNLHCPPKDTPIDVCVKVEPASGLGPGELPKPVR